MKLRAQFNYDTEEASMEAGLECCDSSLTQQHDAEEADINELVRRFGITGQMPQVMAPPTYQDFEMVGDFHSAMALVRAAEDSFMQIPAEVRFQFGNDPAAFVAFCSDPANIDKMREMGIANPKVESDNVVVSMGDTINSETGESNEN